MHVAVALLYTILRVFTHTTQQLGLRLHEYVFAAKRIFIYMLPARFDCIYTKTFHARRQADSSPGYLVNYFPRDGHVTCTSAAFVLSMPGRQKARGRR